MNWDRPVLIKWLVAILIAAATAGLLGVVRPPLYDYDGYVYYWKGASLPLIYLNPHHLLWVPLVWIVVHASQFIHLNPANVLQQMGLLCTAVLAFLMFLLIRRAGTGNLVTCLLVILVVLSPRIWFFSTQNQPYSLMICLTSILLLVLAPSGERPLSRVRLLWGGILVSLCVGLQQAAILWVPAVAVYLWEDSLPDRKRNNLVFWFVVNT